MNGRAGMARSASAIIRSCTAGVSAWSSAHAGRRAGCSPDRSPVLDAFLDVVRANCPVVGASLDRRLGPRIEAAG